MRKAGTYSFNEKLIVIISGFFGKACSFFASFSMSLSSMLIAYKYIAVASLTSAFSIFSSLNSSPGVGNSLSTLCALCTKTGLYSIPTVLHPTTFANQKQLLPLPQPRSYTTSCEVMPAALIIVWSVLCGVSP